MGLNLVGVCGELSSDSGKNVLVAVLFSNRRHVGDLCVRVGQRYLADVAIDGMLPSAVVAFELDLHTGAMVLGPLDDLVALDLGSVFLGVDYELKLMGFSALPGAGDDLDGLAGGEQSIHSSGADPYALLAPALAQTMKFRSVEESPENFRHLLAHNTRAVVLDGYSKS